MGSSCIHKPAEAKFSFASCCENSTFFKYLTLASAEPAADVAGGGWVAGDRAPGGARDWQPQALQHFSDAGQAVQYVQQHH